MRRLALGVALLLVSGCAGDDGGGGPDRQGFAATVADRHGASAAEGECIAGFVFADYTAEEIERIEEDGITALSLARWDAYFHSVVTCLDPAGSRP